jgi:hypothetical protein
MSRVRLGELLLSRGWCTQAQLHEAWEHKVVYGDRLGTNLLALGILDEQRLAEALGVQHGVHAGHGAVLNVDDAAIKLLPAAIAQRHGVVPHHVAERTLYLLMRDPSDLRAVDDVRFATRLKVQPIAVCEARLWRLLSERYGAKAPLRPNPLDQSKRASAPAAPAPPEKAPHDDLVSEDDFHALYARLTGAESGPVPTASASTSTAASTASTSAAASAGDGPERAPFEADAPPVVEVPDWAEDTRPIRLRLVPGTVVSEEAQPAASTTSAPTSTSTAPSTKQAAPSPWSSSPLSESQRVLHAPIGATDDDDDGIDVDVDVDVGARGAHAWQHHLEVTAPRRAVPRSDEGADEIELVEVVDADPDSIPPDFGRDPFTLPPTQLPAVDWSPLAFDDAVAALGAVHDRDDIARIVLRAARARFARACVLTVYPHAFIGWQGVGEGFESDKVVDVAVPRGAQSVFALVEGSRAHYLGPLQRFVAHGAWVKATGKKIPKSLAVLPVLVRGRVVNLIVVDNGHDQHVGSEVGELLILARHIAASYEALMRQV